MTEVYHNLTHEKRRLLNQPDLHSKKWKNVIDKCVYFIGLTGVVLAIPQVFKIYFLKDADGLSLIMWVTYIFTAGFWILYGYAHKEKLIMIINSCWFFIDIAVVAGILLYSNSWW